MIITSKLLAGQTCCQWTLDSTRPSLCHRFCSQLLCIKFLSSQVVVGISTLVPQDHLSAYLDCVVLLASSDGNLYLAGWFAAKCESTGMRISWKPCLLEKGSKAQSTLFHPCPLQVGNELLPQLEEFYHLNFWGERSGRKTDGLVGSSRDMNAASICYGENREKCKGEAVSFLFGLHPYPHLWLWALVSDWKNKITNTNSGMNFLLKVSRLFFRDKLRRWTKS